MNTSISRLYQAFLDHPEITTDSRNVKPGSIFFALKGERFDGNDYVGDAISKGAKLAVADKPAGSGDKRIIVVNDALSTLQELAGFHRRNLKLKIIALTGTNGKTTTKELISRILAKKFTVGSTKGNLNNHIGVPLTLLSFGNGIDFGIVEMGANHIGEIAALCNIAHPDFGLITNIGKAHLEGFGSLEGVLKAKTELYDHMRSHKGIVFLNSANEMLVRASDGIRQVAYGSDPTDGCRGKIISNIPFLSVDIETGLEKISIQSKLTGKYNFENIMAAAAVGSFFGISLDTIKEAIESYEPANHRSQVIKTEANTVIMDAYNANPTSMKAAIENFTESNYNNKVLILGDMYELGTESEKEHLLILEEIKNLDFTQVFLVGETFRKVNPSAKFLCFASTQTMGKYLKDHPMKKSTVLLKGSRKMALERLMPLL